MSSAATTDSSRAEFETLLPDDDRLDALVSEALTSNLVTTSQLSKDRLRDLALTYLRSVLLGGTEQAHVDFARTCVEQGLREDTLAALLAELQVLLVDFAESDESIARQHVQTVTGQDISKISTAFARTKKEEAGAGVEPETVEEIHSQVQNVTKRSTEIGSLTEQQSSNMDELSREIGEISAAVEEIAASTDEVNSQSDDAAALAEEGCVKARDLDNRIDEIHTRATRVNEAVEALVEHIDEIDAFVDTIDDIADQTNMLALNASIEAARVDGGEGFAVVAEEVKSLAEDSQEEAARIRSLVETVDEAATRVTDDIDSVCEQTMAGRQEVDHAVETLDAIEDINAQLSESMADVATATDQQAEGTEELAMMADEMNRKVRMILEEINEIDDSNQHLLDTLESSFQPAS